MPLMAAPGLRNMHVIATTMPAGTTFYPLYISRLGNGRIVCLQWNADQPALEGITLGKFYLHCVDWLAKSPPK
jgi:hypothetical protein